jgi:serine/threonine protein kinase
VALFLSVVVVMELGDRDLWDLMKWYQDRKRKIPLRDVVTWALQLLSALSYIHSMVRGGHDSAEWNGLFCRGDIGPFPSD